jgi:hypothetical protein
VSRHSVNIIIQRTVDILMNLFLFGEVSYWFLRPCFSDLISLDGPARDSDSGFCAFFFLVGTDGLEGGEFGLML